MDDRIECNNCGRKVVPRLWHIFGTAFRYTKTQHICPFCGVAMYETGGGTTPFAKLVGYFFIFIVVIGVGFPLVFNLYTVFWKTQEPNTPPTENQKFLVDAETLESYRGGYKYNSYIIKVSRNGEQLVTQSPETTGVLIPTAKDEFVTSNYTNGFNARVKFERNAKGKVIRMLLIPSNGQQQKANKVE
jgi:hypothetical protein